MMCDAGVDHHGGLDVNMAVLGLERGQDVAGVAGAAGRVSSSTLSRSNGGTTKLAVAASQWRRCSTSLVDEPALPDVELDFNGRRRLTQGDLVAVAPR